MSNFNDMLNIFNENVAIGKAIEINNITLIPVFKVNVNYLLIDNNIDVEEKKESSNANISVTPMCLLQILDDKVTLVSLNHKGEFINKVPGILETLNGTFKFSDVFKAC